jgi:protein-S-isoprenylcysteine O-methyltransferase Ste14/uncharacterized membrane protein (UPF0127 family)
VPIFNETQNLSLKYHISSATGLLPRLIGMLGSLPSEGQPGLFLLPCNGVHTFGMRYPLDVFFLDADGRVVKTWRGLAPNRLTGVIRSAESAIEFPAGVVAESEIRTGDRLRVGIDSSHPVNWAGLRALMHWPMNVCIAGFWFLLVAASFQTWSVTGQISSLGLVLVNAVMCFFFLTRRASTEISDRGADWVIAFTTVGLAMFLRPYHSAGPTLAMISVPFKAIGIVGLLVSLFSLGRSLGIVPANRGIKRAGFYRIIRHPIYASELVFNLGYLLDNTSARNLVLVVLVAAGQVYRLLAEERLLRRDIAYRKYMKTVKYRLLPGLF